MIKIEIKSTGADLGEIGKLLLGLSQEFIQYKYSMHPKGSRMSEEAELDFVIEENKDE